MSSPNSDPVPNPELTSSSGFSTQSQMGLPEILQMCCLSRRSGQITFRSGESYGFVYIQHGRVLHAMCGVTEGEEAIYRMLTWPGGGFSLDEDILPHKKTVTLTWEQLLFEGARRADEGVTGPKTTGDPVKTITGHSTIRTQESQPKLTVMRPDLPPVTCELEREYTHAGRASGNEIPLPYPSVSNRHCIFIMSGPDIVLRDLNSSNGTYVNGEAVDETVLRPGDLIQIGTVQMKFEPGIKRPKLVSPIPSEREGFGALKSEVSSGTLYHATVKLPNRPIRNPQEGQPMDDSAYVKGESAINYNDLAKPEVADKKSAWIFIIGLLVLIIAAGACYYFFFMHGTAKAN